MCRWGTEERAGDSEKYEIVLALPQMPAHLEHNEKIYRPISAAH